MPGLNTGRTVLRRPSLVWCAAIGCCLICCAGTPAAEEAYRTLSPDQVRRGEFKPGAKYSITGKYQELVNRELKLFDIRMTFVLSQSQLVRQVLEYKAQKTNLTVFGSLQQPAKDEGSQPSDHPIFEVEKIVLAAGDAELYDRKLQALLASPNASAETLKKLALEASFMLKRFGDQDLRPVARKVVTAAFSKAETSLPEKDADGRLKLIAQFHEALGDVELVLELLRAQARRFPRHTQTSAFLRKLSCHQTDGEWLTHEEFKKKLGFVLFEDQWVKPERKEFLEVVKRIRQENQINLILRSRTDREYAVLSQEGRVEKGMTREELAATAGLPDRVLRESENGQEIDQWSYGDRRVYLLNGLVVEKLP